MEPVFRVVVIVLGVLIALAALGWLGLNIPPRPFPAYPQPTPELTTVPLPADLPEPVARYYRLVFGDRAPLITSAVISGRASVRPAGPTLPARFRFTHQAGQNYRHYIEVTFFGLPVMKVNEHYIDGQARFATPGGLVENEPKIDMAANLGLWGESVWLPSIFVTDPRVRWEAVNATTARLIVPFGETEEAFSVTFDPDSGLMRYAEALRYREATDEEKILWRIEPLGWQRLHGVLIPTPAAVIWMDQGTPWAIFSIEEVVYNVDVSDYIRATGP